MGLDFSHCDAHWAYSGFMRFRQRLAQSIGIDNLRDMEGFGGTVSWDTVRDDLKPLLYHSDCDGELSVEEMQRVEPRLREIISQWNVDNLTVQYDKANAEELADGMRDAISRNEPMEFR